MKKILLMCFAAPIALMTTSVAPAQDSAGDAARRLDRIERELRAVQRRVFPGAEGGILTPDVEPQDNSGVPASPNAATAVGDINARIDAIEAQLTRLTGQVEQQGFQQREMAASIARLRTEFDGRLDMIEVTAGGVTPVTAAATTAPAPVAAVPAAAAPRPIVSPPAVSPRPTAPPAAARVAAPPLAAPTASTAARRTRVEAVEVPATGNVAEDAYVFGYRLWEARLYPEAQAQLQRVLDTHPQHRRASYAGNLLGRAYIDNGQPSLAVRVLYDNYRNRPRGERAPESVYYMGMALIQLERRPDACRTFDEFTRVYGDGASQSLRDQVAAGRVQARC